MVSRKIQASFLSFLLVASAALAQTAATPKANYTFRFSPQDSKLISEQVTFPKQESLALGTCTTTANINGPITCAKNCSGAEVCLYQFSGPAGLSVADVLQKVDESPISGTGSALARALTSR